MNTKFSVDSYSTDSERKPLVCFVPTECAETGIRADTVFGEEVMLRTLPDLLEKKIFSAQKHETYVLHSVGDSERIRILVGFCTAGNILDALRQSAADAARKAASLKLADVGLMIPEAASRLDGESVVGALCEGFILGQYVPNSYASEAVRAFETSAVSLLYADAGKDTFSDGTARGLTRGIVAAEAVVFARNLINRPGNMLTPEMLAAEASKLAARFEDPIEILDEDALAEQGYGCLLGVGKGSVNPPRLIKIDYLKNPDKKTTIGLVGKSITFDSGGICIKPRKDMDIMISDMSGGAALLGAYYFIAALQLPINAVFVLPAADNLPSGSAFKPGDILISKSGRTVLIKDTDSEGRVTLADGITAAVEAGVNAIVCVATLSGLTAMLFGEYFAPITSDNDDLSDLFTAAAEKVGEPLWRLPYISERPKETKSKVADVSNGERGTVFINGFAAGLPWAFVDIAGTAWTSKTEGIYCEGGTGTMVKTLAELLERFFAKKSPAL